MVEMELKRAIKTGERLNHPRQHTEVETM